MPAHAAVLAGTTTMPRAGYEPELGPAARSPAGQYRTSPAATATRYRALPTTPPAVIDLALLVPDGVTAADVERVLRGAGGQLLERVVLFDEFRGGDLPAGTRSLAWRAVFRDPKRTLEAREVEGRRQKLLKALEGELGVRQRSA